jgi:hypothetical protein
MVDAMLRAAGHMTHEQAKGFAAGNVAITDAATMIRMGGGPYNTRHPENAFEVWASMATVLIAHHAGERDDGKAIAKAAAAAFRKVAAAFVKRENDLCSRARYAGPALMGAVVSCSKCFQAPVNQLTRGHEADFEQAQEDLVTMIAETSPPLYNPPNANGNGHGNGRGGGGHAGGGRGGGRRGNSSYGAGNDHNTYGGGHHNGNGRNNYGRGPGGGRPNAPGYNNNSAPSGQNYNQQSPGG